MYFAVLCPLCSFRLPLNLSSSLQMGETAGFIAQGRGNLNIIRAIVYGQITDEEIATQVKQKQLAKQQEEQANNPTTENNTSAEEQAPEANKKSSIVSNSNGAPPVKEEERVTAEKKVQNTFVVDGAVVTVPEPTKKSPAPIPEKPDPARPKSPPKYLANFM
eukprot:TRINITY_DN14577_c0_g1_i1.p1 TRINITY_DN14577_c0_g1~~TRINITY_DN14577_c0_g1_i1.p1  ORF type:complete len:162 (-),score=25.06 TRINITY_DN14577_c0_g1_i1:940-1425(-)